MAQFILAAFVALCTQIANPPTDEQILAAVPDTGATRSEISIVKNRTSSLPQNADGGRPVINQWQCFVYYTETADTVRVRRVHVVYMETVGG